MMKISKNIVVFFLNELKKRVFSHWVFLQPYLNKAVMEVETEYDSSSSRVTGHCLLDMFLSRTQIGVAPLKDLIGH